MIDSIINTTTSHPVYLAILGVIVILLAYAVIKILSGKSAKTSPAIWVVAVLSVVSFTL